jgi:hypothetical protein
MQGCILGGDISYVFVIYERKNVPLLIHTQLWSGCATPGILNLWPLDPEERVLAQPHK